MNFVKRSWVGQTIAGVKALGGVKALLLLVSDVFVGPWGLTRLSYSLLGLVKGLL